MQLNVVCSMHMFRFTAFQMCVSVLLSETKAMQRIWIFVREKRRKEAASFHHEFSYIFIYIYIYKHPFRWQSRIGIVVCGSCIPRKCSTLKLDYVDVVRRGNVRVHVVDAVLCILIFVYACRIYSAKNSLVCLSTHLYVLTHLLLRRRGRRWWQQ